MGQLHSHGAATKPCHYLSSMMGRQSLCLSILLCHNTSGREEMARLRWMGCMCGENIRWLGNHVGRRREVQNQSLAHHRQALPPVGLVCWCHYWPIAHMGCKRATRGLQNEVCRQVSVLAGVGGAPDGVTVGSAVNGSCIRCLQVQNRGAVLAAETQV